MVASHSPPDGVPAVAAAWIASFVYGRDETSHSSAATIESSIAWRGLRALKVPELKAVAKEIERRVLMSSSAADLAAVVKFCKPRSNAKKAEWMSSIRRCFYVDEACIVPALGNAPIWTALGCPPDGGVGATAEAAPEDAVAGAAAVLPHHLSAALAAATASQSHAASYSYAVPLPLAAATHRPFQSTMMTTASSSSSARCPPPAGRKRHRPADASPPPLSSTAAAPAVASVGAPAAAAMREGPPVDLTHRSYSGATVTGASNRVKIKREPPDLSSSLSSSSLDHGSSFSSSAASAGANDDDDDPYAEHPRDAREWSMMNQLKMMGFTDVREMLAGLRFASTEGCGDDDAAIVEAAMMWIVTQREEAEEARKLDEARISSEYALTEEQKREKESDLRLQCASIAEVLGDSFFPASILLRSITAKKAFRSIMSEAAGVAGCDDVAGKEQVIRYLTLEKKARKWYGSVVPWAYFQHVALGNIEKNWFTEVDDVGKAGSLLMTPPSSIRKNFLDNLRVEADRLERSMYSLSEQEEWGVGRVPKIFLTARKDAFRKGLPVVPDDQSTRENGDDIVVLEDAGEVAAKENLSSGQANPYSTPLPSKQAASGQQNGASVALGREQRVLKDVIEIN